MIRVCDKGHVTGTRTCWCGTKAETSILGQRRQPVTLHPKSDVLVALRVLRRRTTLSRELAQ